jgi:predicted nucleotide-binding protein (sugar kinase/HSP70/actin superfamily)
MPSSNGPCRFGQYNRYHRLILDEFGYKDVPVYAPDQDYQFYKELSVVEGDFPKFAWWGIVAVDLLEKRLRETRPYELNPGDAEKLYWECLRSVCDAVRKKRFPTEELKYAKEAFRKIPVDASVKRPLVGVVGEIYVRCNRFSNEDLVAALEKLGAEVRVPPVGEWLYYTNFVSRRKSRAVGDFRDLLRTSLKDFFQHRYEEKLLAVFNGDLTTREPRTKEILQLASPYLHDSFEGEAVLSVGKVVDYIANGAHGIVNVMPFTCMPGTIVNGILKKVRERYSNIPYLNMVYEGIEDANAKTRLEAFVHQSREFMERRGAVPSRGL